MLESVARTPPTPPAAPPPSHRDSPPAVSTIAGVVAQTVVAGRTIKFFVQNRHDLIQGHHLRGEFYEREELNIIANNWRGDRAFLDIGANVGNHSIFVSKFLGAPKIVVFEPNLPAIAILRLNLLLNQCVEADTRFLGVALGAAESLVRIVENPHPNNLGGTCATPDAEGDTMSLPGDSLLSGESVGFIKIDVEGMEMEVLAGLRKTIERWRPNVFVEVKDQNRSALTNWTSAMSYRIAECFVRYAGLTNYMLLPDANRA